MFDIAEPLLDDLENLVDKLAGEDPAVDVVRLRRLVDRLEYQWLRAVGDADRRGVWADDGFRSPAAWLRHRCRLPGWGPVTLARKLHDLPATAEAFAAGEISRPHAQVLAHAANPERAEQLRAGEAELVDAARLTDAHTFHQIVRRVTDALDGDHGAKTANDRYQRRRLHASTTLDGMVAIDGLLDPEAGQVVVSALEAAMESAYRPDDGRSRPQRRADALVDLLRAGAAHLEVGPGRAHRPHLTTVVDLSLLEARGPADLIGQIRTDAAFLGRLAPETLRRIACDCAISRVITDGPSQVLDVGRTTRTISAATWRALVVRDGGCTEPGCDVPPEWCEVHHIEHWLDGGETKLSNLRLVCTPHHHDEHEGQYPRRE